MKNITVTGMATLVLSLLVITLTGCPSDDPKPQAMTFENADATRRLTINENLEFDVVFLKAIPGVIDQGASVRGKITGASSVWTNDLTGMAAQMKSSVTVINDMLKDKEVGIELTYTKDESTIIEVNLAFTSGDYALEASGLMGGSYFKK